MGHGKIDGRDGKGGRRENDNNMHMRDIIITN
jgi:hypothetical protein